MPKHCPEWIPPGEVNKTVAESHVNIGIIECSYSDGKPDPRSEFARRTRLPVTSKKMTSYHGGGEKVKPVRN